MYNFRTFFRGKWPPGQVPEQTSAKYYGGRPKGGKNISSLLSTKPKKTKGPKQTKSLSKTFHCNICDVTFQCRFKYSNHCGSAAHKEKVIGKRGDFQVSFDEGKSASVGVKTVTERADETLEIRMEDITKPDTHASEMTDEELSEKDAEEVELSKKGTQDAELEESVIKCQEEISDATNQVEKAFEAADDSVCSAVPLQIHICTVCDKKFPDKYYISNHILTKYHRNRASANKEAAFALLERYHKYIVRLSPYQCAICRFYFNSAIYFENHMHSEEHLFNCEDLIGEITCSLCKFKTHNHDELLEHIGSADHKRNTSKRNRLCIIKERHVECRCKYCGIVMRSFSKLKYHVQHKHGDKQVVTGVKKRQVGVYNRPSCPECNHQFQCVSALQLHIRRKHTGEKPHRCEVCDVSFADKHALTIHKKTSKHMQRLLAEEMVKKEIVIDRKQMEDNVLTWEKAKSSDNTLDGSKIVNIGMDIEDKSGNGQCNSETDIVDGINAKKEYTLEVICDNADEKNVMVELNNPLQEESDTIKNFDALDQMSEDELMLNKKNATRNIRAKKQTDVKENMKKKKRKKKGEGPMKIHKCDHCFFTASSYNDLRPHYLKEHSAQIKTCELCDMVFLSDKAFKLHTLSREHQQNINRTGSNISEKYYTCHVCKKKFTDEKYCKFHTAYQHFHLTSEEALLMENGGKDVTRIKYEKVLDDVKDLDSSTLVQCPDCKNTLKKVHLIEHLRIHSGDKPFKCKMCPKAFMSSITLRRHLLGHFGCQERTCEVCGKHFKKIPSFEVHMKLHLAQSGDVGKVHTCEVCGQAFYFERQLQFHLRRHRKREFVCTFPGCHWKFVFATELRYHMQSHTKHKPFLCDICGYATTTKYRLARHHRTHTGERNYHCEYCTYKAGNSTHLHRHMRIHIGSKPFKCPYCNYSCNTHENMRKHIVHTKKHEGLSIYPCKFCKFGTNSCKEFRNHLHEEHETEIGPNFHVSALSTFTGLYDKSLDPKEPEEGNKIFQIRERVQRDPKPKKPRKSKILTQEAKQEDSSVKQNSEILERGNADEKKDKNLTGIMNKKRKLVKLETDRFNSKSLTNISQVNPSRKIPDSDTSKMMNSVGDDILIRTQAPGLTGSYFSHSINQLRLQNDTEDQIQSSMTASQYILVPDPLFKPTIDAHHLKPELQLSLTTGSSQDLSPLQYNRTGVYNNRSCDSRAQKPAGLEAGDGKPTILMYHDYCTKYGVSGETDGPGNLIIDMNFNSGH